MFSCGSVSTCSCFILASHSSIPEHADMKGLEPSTPSEGRASYFGISIHVQNLIFWPQIDTWQHLLVSLKPGISHTIHLILQLPLWYFIYRTFHYNRCFSSLNILFSLILLHKTNQKPKLNECYFDLCYFHIWD